MLYKYYLKIKHTWYNDVIMSVLASQITSISTVCSFVCSGVHKRKHQNSASLAFVRVIHLWPMDSPRKGPVTRKMFPFDHVIMGYSRSCFLCALQLRHNEGNDVSNHQPHDGLLNRLLRRRSKKTLKLRVTGICARNSLVMNFDHFRVVVLGETHDVIKTTILRCFDVNVTF